ncbi:hypothetical protein HRF87_17760, partial [Bacillus sp. CRN 9]|nr:hypothetical protein [Bacillus sp. CRN 9]
VNTDYRKQSPDMTEVPKIKGLAGLEKALKSKTHIERIDKVTAKRPTARQLEKKIINGNISVDETVKAKQYRKRVT